MKNVLMSVAASIACATLLPAVAVAQPTERPLVDKPPTERPLVDRAGAKSEKERKADAATAPDLDPKLLPADAAALAEVDNAFKRWGASWMFDRYLPGSVRATERGLTGETYMLRGTFDFARSGQRITIPFAAAYARTKERFVLSKLCYNDVSSGMTDCVNPGESMEARQAAAAQSRQLMGAIVLMGVAAALTSADETCVKRYNIFGDPYVECD
jgi:hypothetical protein